MKACMMEMKEDKNNDSLFDAILAKNQIAKMIRDKQINWRQLQSCLIDIENELGTMNQPSVTDVIESRY